MNIARPKSWTPRRWSWTILAAVAVQGALIVWLGDRGHPSPETEPPRFRVSFIPSFTGELSELYNASLFARSSRHGFSGGAVDPPPETNFWVWTETARFLPPQTSQLQQAIHQLVQSNIHPLFQVAAKANAAISFPPLPPPTVLSATQSVLYVEGDLRERRLLTPFTLTNVPASPVVTNTVVRLGVNAEGWVQSVTRLSNSGQPDADRAALDMAKTARFESLRKNIPARLRQDAPEMTWGNLVFSWRNAPGQITNATPPQ